jgi:hypothetical protein
MKWITAVLNAFFRTARYCILPGGVDDECRGRFSPWMVTVWGLVCGLIFCGVFAGSWKVFGDIYFSESSRLRLVPIAMVVLAGTLLGFRSLVGLAVTVDRAAGAGDADDGAALPRVGLAGQTALVLAVLLKFAGLLAMPYHTPWLPGDWRRYFWPLYPSMMHSRVLLLLGLWTAAGLLVAGATGPAGPGLGGADRQFRRTLTIRSLIGNLVFTFLVTAVYFSSWRNRGIGILLSFIIFLAVYLVSMAVSWRQKGHDRFTLFACAELAQLLLLFGYLAVDKYL